MEIQGIAHIGLTVKRLEECVAFYDELFKFLGFTKVNATDKLHYYVGGKTAIGIRPSLLKEKTHSFNEDQVGLHHLCFRAKSRKDIDQLYLFLKELGTSFYYPPKEGPWAPGYYSVSFFDPDGIRLEVNHVPGKGVLEEGVKFNPADDYR